MKILFIADGRSPTARSWLKGLESFDHELHLITTYPCSEIPGVKSITFLPVAFSQVGRDAQTSGENTDHKITNGRKSLMGRIISRFRKAFLSLRYILGPLSLWFTARVYRRMVRQINPDLVHALRIPYEGMLAAYTPREYRLVISSWGNDFTLHAEKTWLMKHATYRAMKRADGFIADCHRDIRLAHKWGLRADVPAMFAPGSGGLDLDVIRQMAQRSSTKEMVVINPRGIRPVYVMNDQFFQSLPQVLGDHPGLQVYCAAMRGENDAEKWIKSLSLPSNVQLMPPMSQEDLWEYGLKARVVVSPATHDGTPNSVLECMALGCLPVVGDIEPLREWIVDGENGLLVEPLDPRAIADGILRALEDDALFERARAINAQLVAEKADRQRVMPAVQAFYLDLVTKN
ncbi:MAG: hypothetical protein C0391_08745 [Anaerolinea sp.]|nr:hypothetical protein [Anaerolinea sp.]